MSRADESRRHLWSPWWWAELKPTVWRNVPLPLGKRRLSRWSAHSISFFGGKNESIMSLWLGSWQGGDEGSLLWVMEHLFMHDVSVFMTKASVITSGMKNFWPDSSDVYYKTRSFFHPCYTRKSDEGPTSSCSNSMRELMKSTFISTNTIGSFSWFLLIWLGCNWFTFVTNWLIL